MYYTIIKETCCKTNDITDNNNLLKFANTIVLTHG